jgi:membrane-bound ClpP family serine protease
MRHPTRWFAVLLAAGLAAALPARQAEGDGSEPGVFITVANPITSEVVNQVRETVARAEQRQRLRKIVFDFSPGGKDASTPDFGPCLDLAKFIRAKRGEGNVLTVAYIRAKTSRNTVLPVLACHELVMAPDAVLGPVSPSAEVTPDPDEVEAYKRYAQPDQAALVVKMLDARAAVVEGRRNAAVWYVDTRHEDDAARLGVVVTDRRPVLPAGTLAGFRAADAQKFQLAKAVRATRQQVEELYNLPPGSYHENPLGDHDRLVWRVTARGEVNGALRDSLRRQIDRAVKRGANLVIIQVECSGGSVEAARDVADYLRTLKSPDGRPVMTVAYIPYAAPDTATFLALGCQEIVMARSARLGDFTGWLNPPVKRRGPPVPPPDVGAAREALVQLAEAQGFPSPLVRGLFDTDLEIVRARRARGAVQERRFLSPDELKETDEAGQPVWVKEDTVKHAGKPLVLTADAARSLGVARHVVERSDDVNEVYRFYGVKPGDVREATPDWLDSIANFLADPLVSVFLVLVGISCLILELKMPGASVPGIAAAVCFVLFFWSQSQMHGQITLLAVLLFLLGLVLLGIEILVIPGFGVIGFAGIGLILFGLGLATVERMPETSGEWGELGKRVVQFGLSLVGAMVVAFSVARFLPYIPVANRLVLMPPDDLEAPDAARAAEAAEHVALLGAIGSAVTMLRPAGMAQFAEKFVDVVTEGGFVPAGARVQVVEIEGKRVVVKEV